MTTILNSLFPVGGPSVSAARATFAAVIALIALAGFVLVGALVTGRLSAGDVRMFVVVGLAGIVVGGGGCSAQREGAKRRRDSERAAELPLTELRSHARLGELQSRGFA